MTVLVTGGNRGIGRAIATAFLADGAKVAVTHRGGELPDGAFGVKCDVTSTVEVNAAFDVVEAELGPIDVLVANAGITDSTVITRMSEDQFQSVVDTNLTGAWRCARRAATGMVRRRHGRMIFISSVVGWYGSAGLANYAASKAGLVGLARSLARELGSRGVTANVVAPGYVETDMTAVLPEQYGKQYREAIPLRRFAQPEEVASAVVWLAGADYVTGAVIPVDGGLGMGH
ncbi:beta-ketoacyl-ACP reductase [Lentzea sp. NBRC 105346]|uniref:SDR family oxidoreductase n=1 Tax=Lentzea sp. NBRC 105346 TaxID=3032205 RepID=UPI0024A5CDA1|nr:SDR family oxidoreductase [Lentzea sp. NBRC 105346]GLZ28689.1 beta-ketoacyl-ACP reductase [Lentzea sp. NBRC 105346]